MGGWWAGQPTLGSHLPQAQGWKGEDQTQSWDLLSCQYECTCVVELLYTKKVQVSYISVEDPVTLSGAPMSIPSSWRWSCGVAEWISSSGAEIMQGQAPDRRDTFSAPTAATHVSRVWSCSKWKVLGHCYGLCIKLLLQLPFILCRISLFITRSRCINKLSPPALGHLSAKPSKSMDSSFLASATMTYNTSMPDRGHR